MRKKSTSILGEISGSRSPKARIFPGARTYNIYDYQKPLLAKNPKNIILHIGTNNSINETSRDVLNRKFEKFCPTCMQTIASNMIYRSDNWKGSLTVKKCKWLTGNFKHRHNYGQQEY